MRKVILRMNEYNKYLIIKKYCYLKENSLYTKKLNNIIFRSTDSFLY